MVGRKTQQEVSCRRMEADIYGEKEGKKGQKKERKRTLSFWFYHVLKIRIYSFYRFLGIHSGL